MRAGWEYDEREIAHGLISREWVHESGSRVIENVAGQFFVMGPDRHILMLNPQGGMARTWDDLDAAMVAAEGGES